MHAGCVAPQSSAWERRRERIGQRLAVIQARLDELRAKRRGTPAASGERLAVAQRHVVAAQAAAAQALAASARALRMSAQAHERAALQHERAAAAGSGDKDEHERRAAAHRAAAAAETPQAEAAQSLLQDEQADHARRPDANHTLHRSVYLAARSTDAGEHTGWVGSRHRHLSRMCRTTRRNIPLKPLPHPGAPLTPLPEPTSRERTVGEVLALLVGAPRRDSPRGPAPLAGPWGPG